MVFWFAIWPGKMSFFTMTTWGLPTCPDKCLYLGATNLSTPVMLQGLRLNPPSRMCSSNTYCTLPSINLLIRASMVSVWKLSISNWFKFSHWSYQIIYLLLITRKIKYNPTKQIWMDNPQAILALSITRLHLRYQHLIMKSTKTSFSRKLKLTQIQTPLSIRNPRTYSKITL